MALARGGGRPDDLPLRMAVIGMGKLGGHELHYVSDLDVLFVHEPVAGADRSEVHDLANQVAERLMRSLGQVTAEGTAFEVDADLRPEGRSGPSPGRSSPSRPTTSGGPSRGSTRRCCGPAPSPATSTSARFLELVRPLAYPEDFVVRDALGCADEGPHREGADPASGRPEAHLKLGPGGLSDIEWTVQLLQQRHGAAHRRADPRHDAGAGRAAGRRLLEHRDAAWLRDGYHFLSRVRNRLYLLRPAQRGRAARPGRPTDPARAQPGVRADGAPGVRGGPPAPRPPRPPSRRAGVLRDPDVAERAAWDRARRGAAVKAWTPWCSTVTARSWTANGCRGPRWPRCSPRTATR